MKRNRSLSKSAVSVGKDGESWVIDNDNWDGIKHVFPREGTKDFTIVALEGSTKDLPLQEIVAKMHQTDVNLMFADSLYDPVDHLIDLRRLRLVLATQKLVIKKFYGYLDAEGIALLPSSVKELGLAIGSLSDAEAINSMQPWSWLQELRVCVYPGVGVADLRPLPRVTQKGIFFPLLKDERVPYIVPAIAALVPERRLASLYFPKCALTAAGALQLAETLLAMDNLEVQLSLTIEPCGTWHPDRAEKRKFKTMLTPKSLLAGMMWSMAWLHGRRSFDCQYHTEG